MSRRLNERGPPSVPSERHRTAIPSGPPSTSYDASAEALKNIRNQRSEAMADPRSVFTDRHSSSNMHRQQIQELDESYAQQSRLIRAPPMPVPKRPRIPDPEASPGKDRASLEPSQRGATIEAQSPRRRDYLSGPPNDNHSSPIATWSRSPSHNSPHASPGTLGPAFQTSPRGSQGSHSNPITVMSPDTPARSKLPEWDDHEIPDVVIVDDDEAPGDYHPESFYNEKPPKREQNDQSAIRGAVRDTKGKGRAAPIPLPSVPPPSTIPRSRGRPAGSTNKPRFVQPTANPAASQSSTGLPIVPRIPETHHTLLTEYMGGSTLRPPQILPTPAEASDFCQSLHTGSAIASSHIALFELQVHLHILQSMLTTQEIKRQMLNLQLEDRGRSPMTFRGFLPDPIDRLDDVYNLVACRTKMRGTALDPAKTVSIYGMVRHALSIREEHDIPAITVSGGLPIQTMPSMDDVDVQHERIWSELQDGGDQGDDDGLVYDEGEAISRMTHLNSPAQRNSPSRIPVSRDPLPTPATAKRPIDTSTASSHHRSMARLPSTASTTSNHPSTSRSHASKPASRPTSTASSIPVASSSRTHGSRPTSTASSIPVASSRTHGSRPTSTTSSIPVASSSRTHGSRTISKPASSSNPSAFKFPQSVAPRK